MHSGGLELAKLTYTRLEDNLIRHHGDRRRYNMSTFDISILRLLFDTICDTLHLYTCIPLTAQ